MIAALVAGVWACGPTVIGLTAALSSRAVVQAQDAPVTDDRALERTLVNAEREFARHRTRQALVLLRRAVQRAPSDARAPLRLAALLLPSELSERPDAASVASATEVRSAAEGAAAAPGLDLPTRQRLERVSAWARAVGGDRAGAVEALATRCGRLDDDSALLLRKLAAEFARQGQLADAEAALTHSMRCGADVLSPLSELGAVRLARGRTAEAIETFREVVRRRPGDAEAQRDLAGALLADGRAHEALTLFAAVTATCPRQARCQLDLARAALEAGEAARASTAAREALSLDAHDPAPALVLAAALLATNQPTQAAEAYREALRRRPDDVRATEGLRALVPSTLGAGPDAGVSP